MAKLNVGKWQAARRGPQYAPVMQFYLRMIRMAIFEATRVQGVPAPYVAEWREATKESEHRKELWDAAIMARYWIARPAPAPKDDIEGYLLSFDAACDALGLNADHERLWMLEKIDAVAEFDTDEVYERTDYLTANPPDEATEDLFDAPRVVPALDQGCFFGEAA